MGDVFSQIIVSWFKSISLTLFREKEKRKNLLLCKPIILENVLNNTHELLPSFEVILFEANHKFRFATGGYELYSTNFSTKP